ncbi:beta-ketoacyl synthase N-terminal-like domain-containing protein, partial [Streptomyces sp. BE303]|uniref:beta-ketoacyl synthase N-terminal-like domain-containing protein n=1 Tax=Streptomyces sp. BE303 TaxID=3002528 RepID=UPI002E76D68F
SRVRRASAGERSASRSASGSRPVTVTSRTDAMGGLPTDRGRDLEALYHPDPEHPGTTNTRDGAFVSADGEFDAGLFGFWPLVALALYPLQRLLLVTSW